MHHSELSFRADLTRPVDPSGHALPSPAREPSFSVPSHHSMDVSLAANTLPLVPVCRFEAAGQVARPGFKDPSWVPVQVLVFEGDMLGVSWLTLATFSLFVRLSVPGGDGPFLESIALQG